MSENSDIKYLTSYNYDKLLLKYDSFVRVKCELPNFFKKGVFKSGYLVGSQALLLFSKQYKFNHGLIKTSANDYDILYPFKSVAHTYITLTENLKLKDIQLKDINNNKRVFKCRVYDSEFNISAKVDCIFMYRRPQDIFLSFDFNFLCLYIDISKKQFVLSTQFLEYVEKRIPIIKNVFYEYGTRGRLDKYLHKGVVPAYILSDADVDMVGNGDLNYEFKPIDSQDSYILKFQNIVYTVIVLSRIYKAILTLRKYKSVVVQLTEIYWCPEPLPKNSKPVLKFIHGRQYTDFASTRPNHRLEYQL